MGRQTVQEMQAALGIRLLRQYTTQFEEDFAGFLAAAVLNKVFSQSTSQPEAAAFLQRNREVVEQEVKALSSDNELCELLSSAVYLMSYTAYLVRGGRMSLFSNRYIRYVRALNLMFDDPTYMDICNKNAMRLDKEVLRPFWTLLHFGLFRQLPRSLNEQQMYKRVHAFAVSEHVPFVK